MRPLVLPGALFPFDPRALVGRPWWIAVQGPNRSIRYVRSDGKAYEGLAGSSPTDALNSLARIDSREPVATPPPCEGQVWVWTTPTRIYKRMVIASAFAVNEDTHDVELMGVVWSEGEPGVAWPPAGAQLLDGPFSPWSPVEGTTLADLTEMVAANGAPEA